MHSCSAVAAAVVVNVVVCVVHVVSAEASTEEVTAQIEDESACVIAAAADAMQVTVDVCDGRDEVMFSSLLTHTCVVSYEMDKVDEVDVAADESDVVVNADEVGTSDDDADGVS